MDQIHVRTPSNFTGSPTSPKRKKHISIACERCRKLKIRCVGGEAAAANVGVTLPKSCDRCEKLGKSCEYTEEDGRKQKRQRTMSTETSNGSSRLHGQRDQKPSASDPTNQPKSCSLRPSQIDADRQQTWRVLMKKETSPIPEQFSQNAGVSSGPRSDSSASDTAYTTVGYYRHLGPTAIAPGHKRIKLKARQDHVGRSQAHITTFPLLENKLLPLFDTISGLPSQVLLPQLLDGFFTYFGDNFCFLNRRYLDSLIECGQAPIFLICVMAALGSRFCPPEIFAGYLPSKADGPERKAWEFSIPFLQHAKSLVVSALDLPAADAVGGLLLMSFADFGDNNEAGLWMYTGMAMRMAIELGLHRERGSLDTNQPPTEIEPKKPDSQPRPSSEVSLEDYEDSSKIMLFWCVYAMETCLCSGTGRVPSLKRHEINVRLPKDDDLAVIRAGPGAVAAPTRPEVYPQMARMIRVYAQSIDFLNTGSRQIRFQTNSDDTHRMDRIEELKRIIIEEGRLVPKEIGFGAIYYQAAVKAGQAGPYLILHLFYHLQIAFLTQESLAGDLAGEKERKNLAKEPNRTVTVEVPMDERPNLDLRTVNQELYRDSIKSITDLLTFAKLIDDRALLMTIYANQAFFHAACAYSRDMSQSETGPKDEASANTEIPGYSQSAFPIPSQTSPSMVFHFEDYSYYPASLLPRRGSKKATESTYSFLTLIAKAYYQFLRQAIKDQTQIYAGSGWVDAVLDQRETGLRDVDLSIVSESISTFIRLHDLREPGGSETALSKFVPPLVGSDPSNPGLAWDNAPQTVMPYDFLADTDLNFDPQAFFNDYMFTELANQNGYGSDSQIYGTEENIFLCL